MEQTVERNGKTYKLLGYSLTNYGGAHDGRKFETALWVDAAGEKHYCWISNDVEGEYSQVFVPSDKVDRRYMT